MYKIALCDDEKIFSDAQEKICRNILNDLNIEYEITTYDSGEAFLKSQNEYDLILLDIMMGELNGIELARLIRKADEDVAIIFMTSNRDYSLQGYDVKALHYLLKPIDGELLKRLIANDYQTRFQNQFFVFESRTQRIRVSIKDIVCLETVGRQVDVTLLKETIYYNGKLSELLEGLPSRQFVKCHKAYAINLLNIRELDNQNAIAMNGKIIPISRTYVTIVKKAFMKQMQVE